MTNIQRLLSTAAVEVGYREKKTNAQLDDKTANAGPGNWTKYARDLDNLGTIFNGRKNGYDWCAVFVTWCYVKTFGATLGQKLLCQTPKGLGAGVKYAANYFKQKGQFHSDPQPGDQIFFYGANIEIWAHTGLVEKVQNGRVYTIEGNSGDGVARRSYALTYSKIAGYGRPDWTLVPEQNMDKPVKEDDDMDYEQWKDYMERYRKELQAKPGSASWGEEDREWAKRVSLFQGGTGDDGFMWQDFLTREQLAAVMHRDAKRTGAE